MILCPSMMCASYANLEEEVRALEEAGTDIFHCDIMDGSFVPNISMGLMDVKAVRALTKKMVDVHLMIDHPADKIDWFLDAGADLIYIHPESEPQAMKTLMYIRSRGKLSGLAVNPSPLPSLCFIQTALQHTSFPSAYSGTEHDECPIYSFTARLAFSTVRSSSTRTSLPSFTTISPFTTV